ncbi:hypothetical protein PLICRDRAFT_54171 [Plicaturopsis crispa FD-325 SS-3]|nr:hypothetical protein PLICRDRAFT_54171 [Plicaturopsis crispa FD-325 SS-3]
MDGPHSQFSGLTHPSTPTNSRKRPRENETETQRKKREKAAERQRRKRERDRNQNGQMGMMAYPGPDEQGGLQEHLREHLEQQQRQREQQQQQQQQQLRHEPPPPEPPTTGFTGHELTPEELARRERVRAAARERQRKHRQLVKARKARELGLDMGNDMMPGMEEVHYRVNADGQYHQVMAHEMQPHPVGQEPPFPQGPPLGGQTFASTLLLSFSCAPLLKQHLLRTLSMTNEELASLEPIIAEAWDHWDHQRRMQHYAEQAAKAGVVPNMSGGPYESNGYGDSSQQPTANDIRARFHRPLVAPSPFQTLTVDTQTTTPSSSTTGSGVTSDTMDPHLSSAAAAAAVVAAAASGSSSGTSESRSKLDSRLDPDLGHARGEAEGVAGRLASI